MTEQYFLSYGSHSSRADGMCAMEWVAYLAGEEHSDSPVCVDPVLRRFGTSMNDALPDDERQRLRPYLVRMIGTADDGLTRQRAFLAADWAVRVVAPIGLEMAGYGDAAEGLRALAPVVDVASARTAADAARGARDVRAVVAVAAASDSYVPAADALAHAAYAARVCAALVTYAADAAAAACAAVHAVVHVANGWEQLLPSVLDLLDRMLPTEPIQLPVVEGAVEGADQVCMLQPNQLEGVTI